MSHKTQLTFYFFGFRKVFFDLIVEHTEWNGVTRTGCFKLPPPLLCDQHDLSSWLWDAGHGTSIAPVLLVKKKDQAAKEDKTAKSFKKMFDEFRQKMYDILSRYLASKCL
jgi:hypothetical protein